ncbi:Wings apart-like protein-like protein [Plecturocebus cupreus]
MESSCVARLECSGVISAHYNLCLPGLKSSEAAQLEEVASVLEANSKISHVVVEDTVVSDKCFPLEDTSLGKEKSTNRIIEDDASISSCNKLITSDSSDSPTSASRVAGIAGMCHHLTNIVLLVEMGFLHVGQARLELTTSGDPPTSTSQSARITGVSHLTWPGCLS